MKSENFQSLTYLREVQQMAPFSFPHSTHVEVDIEFRFRFNPFCGRKCDLKAWELHASQGPTNPMVRASKARGGWISALILPVPSPRELEMRALNSRSPPSLMRFISFHCNPHPGRRKRSLTTVHCHCNRPPWDHRKAKST